MVHIKEFDRLAIHLATEIGNRHFDRLNPPLAVDVGVQPRQIGDEANLHRVVRGHRARHRQHRQGHACGSRKTTSAHAREPILPHSSLLHSSCCGCRDHAEKRSPQSNAE
jgi:hypothetical protein